MRRGPFGPFAIYRGTEKNHSPTRPPLRGRFLLDAKKALAAYRSQKHNAARRGIGWELTFKQWCDWWGEDIERRGTRRGCLQMQRYMDRGPYALGNIKKGEPADNVRTRECAHWDAGKRSYHPVYIKVDREPEDGPNLGYSSAWDRIVA